MENEEVKKALELNQIAGKIEKVELRIDELEGKSDKILYYLIAIWKKTRGVLNE